MKTMKRGVIVVQVKENQVDTHLASGFKLCPKSEWKEQEKKAG